MNAIGIFPFGQEIISVIQRDRGNKDVFVLGVYASAVHARWVPLGPLKGIRALAVSSEPEIFWRGENARDIIGSIDIPESAGRLFPAAASLNGPSGRALDKFYLDPLRKSRSQAWLCDLVPYSCLNPHQAKAIKERYLPAAKRLGLPIPSWPRVPKEVTDKDRRMEIESELLQSEAEIFITLGDLPLRWFTRYYGSEGRLRDYGEKPGQYGRLHPLTIGSQLIYLLPLVHPRQASKLGSHSSMWSSVHEHWIRNIAPGLHV
jgi:hypothetical protein